MVLQYQLRGRVIPEIIRASTFVKPRNSLLLSNIRSSLQRQQVCWLRLSSVGNDKPGSVDESSFWSKWINPFVESVDVESDRNGGELVAQVLKSHGVKFMYTLVGGHVSPILVAAEKEGIRVIDTRHEATAVFAADATARMSGTVGVATVTAGPGVTNTVTALKNAQMAESPVILIGGAAATLAKGRGALQDIEQLELLKTVCKKTYTISAVRQIVPTLRKACQVAMSGTPGPVFVEMPIDTLYPYKSVAQESVLKDPKNLLQWIASKYIEHHLRYVFSNAWKLHDLTPLPVDHVSPQKNQVFDCAQLIRNAKRPLILVGSQATLPPTKPEEVSKALMSLGIPVFLGGMARGILGKSHPLQMRHTRKDALKDADLVILAGAVCDFRLSYGRSLPKKAKIVSVNRDKEKMLMNSKQFWTPSLALQCNVGEFLLALPKAVEGYSCDLSWIQSLRSREDEKELGLEKKASKSTDHHLNPIKVLKELDKALPDNSILVADGGDFVGSAAYILRPRGPLSWLDPGPFGTLGVGAGFALGAKLCRPDSQVWIVYGDGSCGYSVIEYDTFKRHKVPIISIVGNDACWMQIAREQLPRLGSATACNLEYSDYQEIVKAFNGRGLIAKRGDDNSLHEIFAEAKKSNDDGSSVLINVLIGRTDFREGSISV